LIVTHGFENERKGEVISIRTGDIIRVDEPPPLSSPWWGIGTIVSREAKPASGRFPVLFTSPADPLLATIPVPSDFTVHLSPEEKARRKALPIYWKALRSFESSHEQQLSFQQNDIVQVVDAEAHGLYGWALARVHLQHGQPATTASNEAAKPLLVPADLFEPVLLLPEILLHRDYALKKYKEAKEMKRVQEEKEAIDSLRNSKPATAGTAVASVSGSSASGDTTKDGPLDEGDTPITVEETPKGCCSMM
jgi:hypothetical protein